MPAYRYRAIHHSGSLDRGTLSAVNESELAASLMQAGFELIETKIVREARASLQRPKKVKPRDLILFCSHMADLLKSGVSFADALRDIGESVEGGPMRDLAADILRAINHGTGIAASFAQYPRQFSPVFLAILAAGEVSGNLAETFARLYRYSETRAKLQTQLRRALRYPLFLVVVTFCVMAFMMLMVVPKVISFLNTIDAQLPLMTRILMTASSLFIDNGAWIALVGMLAALAFYVARNQSERFVAKTDALLLRLPVLGRLLHQLALARFTHSFAILFQSGIGMLASLHNAEATLGNRALQNTLHGIEAQIQSGRSLSQSMAGFMPPFAVRIIRTGETSGQLSKNLQDIATHFDRDIAEKTEALIGMLEPALTLLIGAVLAWVVMAVLGPIYGSLSKLTGGY